MKIFSTFLLFGILSLLFIRCQKDDNPTPASTNTDNIASGPWVHESSGVDIGKDGTIDVPLQTAGVEACRLDNILTFKKDGTAITDEGTAKCNASDPQTTNFNWSFADNESSLIISNNVFTALNGKLKIRTLTNTNFSVGKDTTIAPLGNVTIIVNLKH